MIFLLSNDWSKLGVIWNGSLNIVFIIVKFAEKLKLKIKDKISERIVFSSKSANNDIFTLVYPVYICFFVKVNHLTVSLDTRWLWNDCKCGIN